MTHGIHARTRPRRRERLYALGRRIRWMPDLVRHHVRQWWDSLDDRPPAPRMATQLGDGWVWPPRSLEEEPGDDWSPAAEWGEPDPLDRLIIAHQRAQKQGSNAGDGDASDAPDHRGPGWPVNGAPHIYDCMRPDEDHETCPCSTGDLVPRRLADVPGPVPARPLPAPPTPPVAAGRTGDLHAPTNASMGYWTPRSEYSDTGWTRRSATELAITLAYADTETGFARLAREVRDQGDYATSGVLRAIQHPAEVAS